MNKLFIAAGLTILAACSSPKPVDKYTVTAEFDPEMDSKIAYIVNYDTGDKIDSATVASGKALFEGEVETPVLARLLIDGRRVGTFALEPDSITIVKGQATGGSINAAMDSLSAALDLVDEKFSNLPDSIPFDKDAYTSQRNEVMTSALNANVENPLGYYVFLQLAYDMSLDELNQFIAEHPSLANYQRVQKLQSAKVAQQETGEGKMFKDFEIVYNDSTYKLSDYVGKGKYTLVDFWASWCGPCIRETAVIKDIYNEYGPKGLEVLGVAVWDEPENTLKAIETHQLPWQQIINGQNVPTDLYGISGIPCIILFGPDGTIVSRGKQGEALKAAVAEAMTK